MTRFKFIIIRLLFDTRTECDKSDRLSLIGKIWKIFINNYKRHYKTHSSCTIDEILGFKDVEELYKNVSHFPTS